MRHIKVSPADARAKAASEEARRATPYQYRATMAEQDKRAAEIMAWPPGAAWPRSGRSRGPFPHLATALEQACLAALLVKIGDARFQEDDRSIVNEIMRTVGPMARALSDRFSHWA